MFQASNTCGRPGPQQFPEQPYPQFSGPGNSNSKFVQVGQAVHFYQYCQAKPVVNQMRAISINNQMLDVVFDRLLWNPETQQWSYPVKQFWMKYEAALELAKILPTWLEENKPAFDAWKSQAQGIKRACRRFFIF
jgi:hypothetical protein